MNSARNESRYGPRVLAGIAVGGGRGEIAIAVVTLPVPAGEDHPPFHDSLLTMPDRSRKPRDPNAMAKAIVDEATDQAPDQPQEPEKDPAAVSLGRRGGLKGGPARAAKLSAKKRSDIARKAAAARWQSEK